MSYNTIILRVLWITISLSIVVLFGLRLYAIYYGSYIQTPWDNKQYREYAVKESNATPTVLKAVENILLPTSRTAVRNVSIGYHCWLVLGQRLNRSLNFTTIEITFQLVNFGLFIFQAILVFLFSRWASENVLFSLVSTFLFLSSPAVFGLNRWVLTENHVFTSLLVFSYFASQLLSGHHIDRKFSYRHELLLPALTAYVIGLFSTVREYGVPYLVIILICVLIGLLLERRYLAATVFVVILSPFLVKLSMAMQHTLLKSLLKKSADVLRFYPLKEWVPHVFLYFIGPAMSIFLIVLVILIIGCIFRNNFKHRMTGLHILSIGHVFLVFFYALAIVLLKNRILSEAIPLMISIFCLNLIAIHGMLGLRKPLLLFYGQISALLLMMLSWAVLIYQLFFAFNGGKSYELHPFNMEYFNFPMHLRQLQGPNDYHVSGGKDWQAFVKQYVEDHKVSK